MLFQYQAGPRSSYRLISSSPNVIVSANGGGNLRIGVSRDSGAVRSRTSIVPALIPHTTSDRTPITPPRRHPRPRCVQVSLEPALRRVHLRESGGDAPGGGDHGQALRVGL